MAWRLRQKLLKAPSGQELVRDKLDEFESRMREVTSAPRGEAMNHELSWPVHRLHYEKNRYLHDMRYVHNVISDDLLRYLVREKIADGPLIAKWRKPGYETLCSLAVITRSNTNFGTVGICRTPLRDRTGQIMPNVMTGCVCCVSGRSGPIWWNDPVPDIVRERLLSVDPGKAVLLEEMDASGDNNRVDTGGMNQDSPPLETNDRHESSPDEFNDNIPQNADSKQDESDIARIVDGGKTSASLDAEKISNNENLNNSNGEQCSVDAIRVTLVSSNNLSPHCSENEGDDVVLASNVQELKQNRARETIASKSDARHAVDFEGISSTDSPQSSRKRLAINEICDDDDEDYTRIESFKKSREGT